MYIETETRLTLDMNENIRLCSNIYNPSLNKYMSQGEKNVQPDQDLNTGPLEYYVAAVPTELPICINTMPPLVNSFIL